MKTLELTEEHKSKLEEMTKSLFPDYNFNYFYSGLDIMSFNSGDISWFEFCMIYIKSKINELNGITNHKVLLASDKGILINHPVYYLYEQFKKLKL